MFQISNIRAKGAVLGAALLTLIAGCSDVPSGLRQPLSGPLAQEWPVNDVADQPLVEATTLRPLMGERRQRRSIRGVDGEVLVIESIVGVDGRPRASVMTKNGAFLMRINNEWGSDASGRLDRQQVHVRGPDGGLRGFDSRDVSAAELATARAKLRDEAEQMSRAKTKRVPGLAESMGDCDAEVNAANVATWQYVTAAATLLAASATGNFLAAGIAYTAFLTSYANYQTKQVDLDKCIARIGKQPVYDEY